ncbi:MAG: hypothetical protein ACKPKO_16765, partial [Candidatus Fonsibacter sp.]
MHKRANQANDRRRHRHRLGLEEFVTGAPSEELAASNKLGNPCLGALPTAQDNIIAFKNSPLAGQRLRSHNSTDLSQDGAMCGFPLS